MAESISGKNITIGVLAVVVLVATASALWGWYHPAATVSRVEWRSAHIPKAVTRIERVEVPVEKVVVIEKEAAIRAADIPPALVASPERQVVAIGDVEVSCSDSSGSRVAAIIDTVTGTVELHARPLPRPLFGFENAKELGLRGGVTLAGIGGEVYGRWTFARVGAIHLAATTSATATEAGLTAASAMLEVSYRW